MNKIKELWYDLLMSVFLKTGSMLWGQIIIYAPGDEHDEDRPVKAVHFGGNKWDIYQSARELISED